MLYRLSTPSNELPFTGTPMTGREVCAAAMPGKCAAPPAAAMMTLMPRAAAAAAYSAMYSGVRCADVISTSASMPKSLRIWSPGISVFRSLSEPMTTPTVACGFESDDDEVEEL